MKRTAVIMAGGTGERFWPLSRKTTPKQLLPLVSSKTMLEDAVERVSGIIPPEDVFIVTSKLLQQPIRSVLKNVPPENVVAEPCKRNTAPCLALAAAFIKAKYGKNYIDRDISIAVLTADHSIQPKCGFEATIAAALDYVEENDAISIIGITPTRPDTGYGYIELGKVVSPENSLCTIHQAVSFKEKPDIDTACAYLESGNYLWNGGMFFWRLDTFIKQMKQTLPEVGTRINELSSWLENSVNIAIEGSPLEIEPLFDSFPNISIDYGLMENAENIVAAAALFEWDDIGSWDALARTKTADSDGNIIVGDAAVVDCQNAIIYNDSNDSDGIVACLGVDNIVVVRTDDITLVIPKDRVQDLRSLVAKIRSSGAEKWL